MPVKIKDITGQRFGKLVVIARTRANSQGNVIWECRCDCGNTAYVKGVNLRNGSTTSCGCMSCIGRKKDITNQRFGKLVALYPTEERNSAGCVLWECQCDCGNRIKVVGTELRQGRVNETRGCSVCRGREN